MLVNKKYFIVLFLLVLTSINGQNIIIKGKVINSKTNLPLEYVNIMLQEDYIGTSTDIQGNFNLNLKQDIKSDIVFSSLGFKTNIISLDSLRKIKTVYMLPSNIILDEIIITNKKSFVHNKKTIVINKFSKRKNSLIYSTKAFERGESLWVPFRENEPTIEAIYFPNNKGTVTKIKEVLLHLGSFTKNPKFKLHLYKPNDEGLPSDDLINLPIQEVFLNPLCIII